MGGGVVEEARPVVWQLAVFKRGGWAFRHERDGPSFVRVLACWRACGRAGGLCNRLGGRARGHKLCCAAGGWALSFRGFACRL